MKKYYELNFDRYFKGRWYLDGPHDDDARDEREFRYGLPIKPRGPLRVPIHTAGYPLDITFTLSQVPVISRRVANAIRPLVHNHAQLFPADIKGFEGFEILVPIVRLACVDETRSRFTKWTADGARPDRVGEYHTFEVLYVDPTKIPEEVNVFRILTYTRPLIVSQEFINAILPLEPTGLAFVLVV